MNICESCEGLLNPQLTEEKELILVCTKCLEEYETTSDNYILNEKIYLSTFDDEEKEQETEKTMDYNLIINNPTIMNVYFSCPSCKKETIAKHWRSEHTMQSKYICKECKKLF